MENRMANTEKNIETIGSSQDTWGNEKNIETIGSSQDTWGNDNIWKLSTTNWCQCKDVTQFRTYKYSDSNVLRLTIARIFSPISKASRIYCLASLAASIFVIGICGLSQSQTVHRGARDLCVREKTLAAAGDPWNLWLSDILLVLLSEISSRGH